MEYEGGAVEMMSIMFRETSVECITELMNFIWNAVKQNFNMGK